MQPTPNHFLMPASLRDALIAYLQERPHKEVEHGISALRMLEPAPEPVTLDADHG